MIEILQYTVVATIIFAIIDIVWKRVVANNLYENEVGEIIRHRPNYIASILVYIFIAFGLVFFVTEPAMLNDNLIYAILGGLLFGFIVSSVYALTNFAAIEDWSITITIMDVTWISFLTAITSMLTYFMFA